MIDGLDGQSTKPKRGRKSTPPSPYTQLSWGMGGRLFSEDYFLTALKPLGMTRRGFRAWMRALSVPMLEIGRVRFIDSFTFALAMRAALRLGQPDFLAPGSESLRRGAYKGATSLDTEYFRKNMRAVLSEVIAQKARPNKPTPEKIRSTAYQAAEILADVGFASLPTQNQTRNADKLAARYPSAIDPLNPSQPIPDQPSPENPGGDTKRD